MPSELFVVEKKERPQLLCVADVWIGRFIFFSPKQTKGDVKFLG
jgi:hypothetical protein